MALASPASINKSVTTAGTRVALVSSSTLAINVVIQANSGNTGVIYVGDSTVSSSVFGVKLTAGNSVSIELPPISDGAMEVDLADIYLDSGTNGDGVSVMYFKRS
jgi:hypothetical protein